jgi:hypothetical protein
MCSRMGRKVRGKERKAYYYHMINELPKQPSGARTNNRRHGKHLHKTNNNTPDS